MWLLPFRSAIARRDGVALDRYIGFRNRVMIMRCNVVCKIRRSFSYESG